MIRAMSSINKKEKKFDEDEENLYSTDRQEAAEEEQDKFHKTVIRPPLVGAEYDDVNEITKQQEKQRQKEEKEQEEAEEAEDNEDAESRPQEELKSLLGVGYHPKRMVRKTFMLLNGNFGSFMRFEILYKLISFFLFYPFLEFMERQALRISGVYYLSNYNLRNVIKNPIVWIMLFGVLLLMSVFTAVEFFALSSAIHASRNKVKITAKDMFYDGISRIRYMFLPKNWIFFLYVFMVLPMVDLYDCLNAVQHFSVPGYLIERLMKKDEFFPYAAVLTCVLLVLCVWWVFTIPGIVVRRQDFKTAVRKSFEMMRWHFLPTIMVMIGWLGLIALIFMAVFVGLLEMTKYGLMWLDPSIDPSVATSGNTIMVLEMIVFLVFTWFFAPLVFCRIQAGYYDRLETMGTTLSSYRPSRHIIRERWWTKAIAWGCILLCCYSFIPGRYQQIKTAVVEGGRGTMVMAHRGDSVSAPENTLPAFKKAIENGADAIELDVQLTKDGTVVVLHDSSLRRTTGKKKKIWEVTYDQIKNLDNGSFFSKEYQFTHIPTLDQTLKLCKGRAFLNIEIKRTGHDAGIVEKTLEIIAANHYEKDCDITSMDYNTLRQIKRLNPDIYTVYTTTVGGGDLAKLTAANAFSVEQNFVSWGFVQYMKSANKGIFVWTVNDATTINKMIDLDVDAIISNDVSLCRSLMASNSGPRGVLQRIQRVFLNL